LAITESGPAIMIVGRLAAHLTACRDAKRPTIIRESRQTTNRTGHQRATTAQADHSSDGAWHPTNWEEAKIAVYGPDVKDD